MLVELSCEYTKLRLFIIFPTLKYVLTHVVYKINWIQFDDFHSLTLRFSDIFFNKWKFHCCSESSKVKLTIALLKNTDELYITRISVLFITFSELYVTS